MLRITAGRWRGRKLATPPGDATRPSMDAHRLNLFNVVGQDLTGERVLDLFAGSGAFALESLSRGAASAVLVERGREALDAIRRNVAAVGASAVEARVLDGDCYALPPFGAPFDLVFVAPPYPHFAERRADLERLLASLAATPLLAADGIAVVQSDGGDFSGEGLAGLTVAGRRTWGRTDFTFLRRAPA